MSEAKIAVIVPVYNAENFLKRCLNSILNQENFKEVKVICINDASPDSSKIILEEYAKLDDRIVVLNHEKNKGAGAARNTGLDYIFNNLPSIEYISMVDADDRIEPNTYSKTYEVAKNSGADIVNFNFLPSTSWEYKTTANSESKEYENNCIESIFEHKEFYTFVLCWSKIYKKGEESHCVFEKRQKMIIFVVNKPSCYGNTHESQDKRHSRACRSVGRHG